MAEEADNLVLQMLRLIRAKQDDHSARFDGIDSVLSDVQRTLAGHELRLEAIEERVETIREGAVTAIGYAAQASRGHVDLRKQIAELPRRVEKLEAGH